MILLWNCYVSKISIITGIDNKGFIISYKLSKVIIFLETRIKGIKVPIKIPKYLTIIKLTNCYNSSTYLYSSYNKSKTPFPIIKTI